LHISIEIHAVEYRVIDPINAKVAVIQTARYLYSPIDVGFVGLARSHSDPV
jgi:hypothetical protein